MDRGTRREAAKEEWRPERPSNWVDYWRRTNDPARDALYEKQFKQGAQYNAAQRAQYNAAQRAEAEKQARLATPTRGGVAAAEKANVSI